MGLFPITRQSAHTQKRLEKCGDNRKVTVLTVHSTIQPRLPKICVSVVQLRPSCLYRSRSPRLWRSQDAARKDPVARGTKHTFTHRVVRCFEDARTRDAGDVDTFLLALLGEFLPCRLLLVLFLRFLSPDFQFLLVLLFLSFPLVFLVFRQLSFVTGRRQIRIVRCLMVGWYDPYRRGIDEFCGVVGLEYDCVEPVLDRSTDGRNPSGIPLAIGGVFG